VTGGIAGLFLQKENAFREQDNFSHNYMFLLVMRV